MDIFIMVMHLSLSVEQSKIPIDLSILIYGTYLAKNSERKFSQFVKSLLHQALHCPYVPSLTHFAYYFSHHLHTPS